MWFALSLTALVFLAARRSSEKKISGSIPSSALAWLQQGIALPFIIGTLFFARFYWPNELSTHYWATMAVYVFCCAIDVYCYFKALSLADISYVAPLLSLVAAANIAGAYLVLGQKPSVNGIIGAALVVTGAYIVNRAKRGDKKNAKKNALALVYVLILVIIRGYYSNIELSMVRESNPTTFNFYSSVIMVPFILLVSSAIIRRQGGQKKYWQKVRKEVGQHYGALLFVGITYTLNMIATYQAKVLSPNAGYVGAIKSASVLPVVFIGVIFFKEKIVRAQWYGIALIVIGLAFLALN